MKFLLILFYLFPTLAFSESLFSKDAVKKILFLDYEFGQLELLDQNVVVVLPENINAIQTDCTQARRGRCSQLTQIHPYPDYISQSAWRAETNTMNFLPARYSPGDHFVYRFSIKLADDWDLRLPKEGTSQSVDIIWQFKRFNGPPDMFVAVKSGALVLRISPSSQITLLPAPLPLGRWIDLEFDVHWAVDERGEVDVLTKVHGQPDLKSHHLGPNLRNSRAQSGYLKWGLYMPDAQSEFTPRTVWHDAIEVLRIDGK